VSLLSLDIGVATRAMPSTDCAPCGDVGFTLERNGRYLLGLIDGLGHGDKARQISDLGREEVLKCNLEAPLDVIMLGMIEKFRGDRGFVIMLCRIAPASNSVEYCGIGNITGRLFNQSDDRTLISGRGIVGQYSATPRSRVLEFSEGSVLLLHSDGISSNLRTAEVKAALSGVSQDAAEHFIEVYARDKDDAGVVVAKGIK